MIISTQPYKGTKDLYPEDYLVQEYIFNTWRKVCKSYGYKEYLTPLLESAEIYKAKSGEDIGGKELFTLTDRSERELAIRPEMTPSVTRMVARKYKELTKPIRLYSIANFYRNERPQRGRNREFWQLNTDVFGEESLNADIEIICLAIDLMRAFNPPDNSFRVFINNRKLINFTLVSIVKLEENKITAVSRIMDKYGKVNEKDFNQMLSDTGLSTFQVDLIQKYMKLDVESLGNELSGIEKDEGFIEIQNIIDTLNKLGYGKYVEFKPNLIRGFDYYTGMVFEVFDQKPENNRSLFGGGRYNGLANIFGVETFPAVGFAPGDETMRLFLESWGLLPVYKNISEYLVTVWPQPDKQEEFTQKAFQIAKTLRTANKKTEVWLNPNTKIERQLAYANKKGIAYVVIQGPDELKKGVVTIKDLKTGEQKTVSSENIISNVE